MNDQTKLIPRLLLAAGIFLVGFGLIGMWANAVHKFGPRCVSAYQGTLGIIAFLMLVGFLVWLIED